MDIKTLLTAIPTPPVAELMGWEPLDYDSGKQELTVRFQADSRFVNARGKIQGKILTAILQDTMNAAVMAASGCTKMCLTTDIQTRQLAPVSPGTLVCTARVTQLRAQSAAIQGTLLDAQNTPCFTATCAAILANFSAPT